MAHRHHPAPGRHGHRAARAHLRGRRVPPGRRGPTPSASVLVGLPDETPQASPEPTIAPASSSVVPTGSAGSDADARPATRVRRARDGLPGPCRSPRADLSPPPRLHHVDRSHGARAGPGPRRATLGMVARWHRRSRPSRRRPRLDRAGQGEATTGRRHLDAHLRGGRRGRVRRAHHAGRGKRCRARARDRLRVRRHERARQSSRIRGHRSRQSPRSPRRSSATTAGPSGCSGCTMARSGSGCSPAARGRSIPTSGEVTELDEALPVLWSPDGRHRVTFEVIDGVTAIALTNHEEGAAREDDRNRLRQPPALVAGRRAGRVHPGPADLRRRRPPESLPLEPGRWCSGHAADARPVPPSARSGWARPPAGRH